MKPLTSRVLTICKRCAQNGRSAASSVSEKRERHTRKIPWLAIAPPGSSQLCHRRGYAEEAAEVVSAHGFTIRFYLTTDGNILSRGSSRNNRIRYAKTPRVAAVMARSATCDVQLGYTCTVALSSLRSELPFSFVPFSFAFIGLALALFRATFPFCRSSPRKPEGRRPLHHRWKSLMPDFVETWALESLESDS